MTILLRKERVLFGFQSLERRRAYFERRVSLLVVRVEGSWVSFSVGVIELGLCVRPQE